MLIPAVGLALLGVLLLSRPDPSSGAARRWYGGSRQLRLPLRGIGTVAGLAVVMVLSRLLDASWLVPAAVLGSTVAWIIRHSLVDKETERARAETLHICLGLAAALRAGSLPGQGLAMLAAEYPCLRPSVGQEQAGGDIAESLTGLAKVPGREGFAELAQAWRLAEVTGAPMADIATRIADLQRSQDDTRRTITAELSSSRVSARLLALLPGLGLLLGQLAGGDPTAFLLDHPVGRVLLLVASVLASLGLVWTERLARSPGLG